jgi:hypothetical protein
MAQVYAWTGERDRAIRYCSLATNLRLGGRTWRVNRSRLQGLRVDRGADYGAGFS